MIIKPLADRLAVIADDAETQTESGLFIATKAGATTTKATVVGVGPEATDYFHNDDRIMFVSGTGQEMKIQDTTYTFLESNGVIGILKEDGLFATQDNIVCTDADLGDQTTSAGIIIKSNVKESQGITSRWMRVHKVGPEQELVSPDQWVLVEYGRWTEGFAIDGLDECYRVDPLGLLAVSDDKPDTGLYYNDNVVATSKQTLPL
jgi:co-chaperonin GroES (HSP10)